MKKLHNKLVNKRILISILSLFLIIFNSCSILDSFDSKAHVRFINNTTDTFAGVRIDGGAESNNTFAPSTTTKYLDNDAGNFGIDVKIGDTWTFVSVLDGGTLSITTGNDYSVTISGTNPNYTASQKKD